MFHGDDVLRICRTSNVHIEAYVTNKIGGFEHCYQMSNHETFVSCYRSQKLMRRNIIDVDEASFSANEEVGRRERDTKCSNRLAS